MISLAFSLFVWWLLVMRLRQFRVSSVKQNCCFGQSAKAVYSFDTATKKLQFFPWKLSESIDNNIFANLTQLCCAEIRHKMFSSSILPAPRILYLLKMSFRAKVIDIGQIYIVLKWSCSKKVNLLNFLVNNRIYSFFALISYVESKF